jgi:hypothetical protein
MIALYDLAAAAEESPQFAIADADPGVDESAE